MNYPTTQPSLLERVQNGDEISWDEFYSRYAPVIRAAGQGFRFNDAECDDLVQQVMMKFFAGAKTYVYRRGEVKFRTYFSRIVHNQAVDMIRRSAARRGAEGAALPADPAEDVFEKAFMAEWRKAVLSEALEELRGRVKFKNYQAFQLCGLQGRPAKDVASLLEISEHQVHVAKSRCTEMLREIVARYNASDGALKLDV